MPSLCPFTPESGTRRVNDWSFSKTHFRRVVSWRFEMKRVLVISILCGCFVSVASTQQAAGTCSNNWTEFHLSNMQRWNPCEKVLNVNNVGSLGLKWQFGTIFGPFLSSPAVADGVVYVGLGDGWPVCAKLRDPVSRFGRMRRAVRVPRLRWQTECVYVGSVNGNVYALNARTGAKLWSYKTRGNDVSSPRPLLRTEWFMLAPTMATCTH